VVRAEATRARAVAADDRTETAATRGTRKLAEAALATAEGDRNGAAEEMSNDAATYDSANALVARTQATAAQAARLRAQAAVDRDRARALVSAATATRIRAQVVRDTAHAGRTEEGDRAG